MPQNKRLSWLIEMMLLLVIPAVVYLPNVFRLTYQLDDWYFMYDGMRAGPGTFIQMFNIDRPARGVFFEIAFSLFGTNPLPYHLATFVFHVLAGIVAAWLFRLLWPTQRRMAFLAGLLVILYPAYFFWVQGIEYLPHVASLFLEIVSIYFSLKAVLEKNKLLRVAWVLSAIVSGWIYLGLVEYAIGMELFRLLCLYVLVRRLEPASSSIRSAAAALRAWSFNLLIPAGFLFWRLFIFQNIRKATDPGVQLSRFLENPELTGPWWLVRLMQSMFNMTILAWTSPFNTQFFSLRLREMLFAIIIAGICVVLFVTAWQRFYKQDNLETRMDHWYWEAMLIGLGGCLFGILPVVLANRVISFTSSTYYGLPVSIAAVFFVVAALQVVSSQNVKLFLASSLLVSAAITHYGLGVRIFDEQQTIRTFWWQMAWRAPMIAPGTTLVGEYPGVYIGADTDKLWGPANFIYYPDGKKISPVPYSLSAVSASEEDVQKILANEASRVDEYRSHTMLIDYANILVLSQPIDGACVHALDGRNPRLSPNESRSVALIAAHSRIENIRLDGKAALPPAYLFGPEPAHTWCYYYQKAELALQAGEYQKAAALGQEAQQLGLHPVDRSEWMPFLQAYAVLGDRPGFETMMKNIRGSAGMKDLACKSLTQMGNMGVVIPSEMLSEIDLQLCN